MREKVPATIFFGLTSTNVGISLQTFLTFELFCHTRVKFQGHAYCESQIIEPRPRAPLILSRDKIMLVMSWTEINMS